MNPIAQLFKRWTQMSLMLRILIGLVIGAFLGMVVPEWAGISILGQVFVSALKAIAPVLVAVLVVASIAKAREGLGPRFRVLILSYVLSTFVAALCAVGGVPSFQSRSRWMKWLRKACLEHCTMCSSIC